MGELPVHAHVGRDLQELGQVEGEAEHEDGRQVDHQPPPAPHPRVQRVADPAVTLNTAREKVQFSRFNITNPQLLKVIWHACTHLMETVRYMEVTRAQLPMGMQKRKMGSKTCQWSPSSKLWVLPVQYSTVQYSTVQYSSVQCSTVQYSTVQYNAWSRAGPFYNS